VCHHGVNYWGFRDVASWRRLSTASPHCLSPGIQLEMSYEEGNVAGVLHTRHSKGTTHVWETACIILCTKADVRMMYTLSTKLIGWPIHQLSSRITSTKSSSFCLTTSSASLTVLLPQSRDCNWHVSRRLLAPSTLWLQKHTDPRARDFAHSPDLWHQPRLANFAYGWSWRLCGNNPAIPTATGYSLRHLSQLSTLAQALS